MFALNQKISTFWAGEVVSGRIVSFDGNYYKVKLENGYAAFRYAYDLF